jgi:cell division protein FtsN
MLDVPPPPAYAESPASTAPAMIRGRVVFASVQLGAYASRSVAEQVMRDYGGRLQVQPEPALRVHEVVVHGHHWFRVLAGPFPSDTAQALCHNLSAQRSACMVRPEAER